MMEHFLETPESIVTIIGTVTLDVLYLWDARKTEQQLQMSFGGVCKNVACTLGSLGVRPQFVSVRFSGELGNSIADYFRDNNVEWLPLAYTTSLSFFQADVDANGNVTNERFVDSLSLDAITPEAVAEHSQAFSPSVQVIVTCTDLSANALNELLRIASDRNASFWLLSSSVMEVRKIDLLVKPADFIGVNKQELQALVGRSLSTVQEVAGAGKQIVPPDGNCLITMGDKGAIICQGNSDVFFYQPVVPVFSRSLVGAGDVLFAALLAGRLQGKKWEIALQFATEKAQLFFMRDHDDNLPYKSLVSGRYALPPLEYLELE